MLTIRIVLFSSLLFLSAHSLRAQMVLDTTCTGTTLVSGTTFTFNADASGSGDCPTNTNLVFANTGPVSWFNLDVVATVPTGFDGGAPPCGFTGPAPFITCVTTFDSSTHVYSAFFSGVDGTHPGIQVSTVITNTDGGGSFRTHEFGFAFSGFAANQQFTANANVSVPEPSSIAWLLTDVLMLAILLKVAVRLRLLRFPAHVAQQFLELRTAPECLKVRVVLDFLRRVTLF
jgi:hypothetical protein